MEKVCKVQLVGELTKLFSGFDSTTIDNAVAQAKNILAQKSKKDLDYLFDSYLKKLEDRDCPKEIVEMAKECKSDVIAEARKMTILEGRIPFVGPIISPTYLGYQGLMAMTMDGEKKGCTHLNPSKIADKILTPKKDIYWLYDVEDGEVMLGENPRDAEDLIKGEGRTGLTTAEIINLCILTDTLSKHNVDGIASRYESDGVPCLYIDGDGPRLRWYDLNRGSKNWGAPSCGSRG